MDNQTVTTLPVSSRSSETNDPARKGPTYTSTRASWLPWTDRLIRSLASSYSRFRKRVKLARFWIISQWCRLAGHKWPVTAQFRQKNTRHTQSEKNRQLWSREFAYREFFYCQRCTKFLKSIQGPYSEPVEVGAEKIAVPQRPGTLLGIHTPKQIEYYDKMSKDRAAYYGPLIEAEKQKTIAEGGIESVSWMNSK